MAERTGHEHIDAQIKRYIERDEWVAMSVAVKLTSVWGTEREVKDEVREQDRRPLSMLQGSTGADGNCDTIAYQFTKWLENHSVKARYEADLLPIAEWGYNDRMIHGCTWHTATIVEAGGHEYMIDFTAAQYGYGEFPLVQRREAGGQWQREFDTLRADRAA